MNFTRVGKESNACFISLNLEFVKVSRYDFPAHVIAAGRVSSL